MKFKIMCETHAFLLLSLLQELI